MAIYTIDKQHTFDDICKIHNNTVQNVKNKNYSVLHTTIADFMSLKK